MRAIVLGVSGMTGRAIARELVAAGHDVVGTGRSRERFPAELAAAGVEFVESDRHDRAAVGSVLSSGADVVVDCVCYTGEQASWLLEHRDAIGSAVLLSSKAVYRDALGRHSNSAEAPDFGGPVTEAQPVLDPDFSGSVDRRDSYGATKVAAEQVLLASGWPVSVLRPSRIHGVGSARPREWFFVRRILDGRSVVPLAHGGRTANHPTAAANLARLVAFCCTRPGRRVLNAADPDAPTAAGVAGAVAAACGAQLRVVGLPDELPDGLPTDVPGDHGRNPWDTWPPFLLDTGAATELGYRPVGTYAETVGAEVDWLLGLSPADRHALDRDPYFAGRFDYDAEDRLLAALGDR